MPSARENFKTESNQDALNRIIRELLQAHSWTDSFDKRFKKAGSIEGWPLEDRTRLVKLLGQAKERILEYLQDGTMHVVNKRLEWTGRSRSSIRNSSFASHQPESTAATINAKDHMDHEGRPTKRIKREEDETPPLAPQRQDELDDVELLQLLTTLQRACSELRERQDQVAKERYRSVVDLRARCDLLEGKIKALCRKVDLLRKA